MCGASSELKSAYETAKGTASTLMSDFNKVFSGNQNILSGLEGSLTPIVGAGVGQYGFTPTEDTAMRTQAKEEIAAAGRQASNKVGEQVASMGGGNIDLPSGSKAAIQGSLAEDQAMKQAEAQLGITQKGYDVGRSNYWNATKEAASAPGELENPATMMEGQLVSANKEAAGLGEKVTAANRAWEKPVMGAIGSALDFVAPGLGGAAGKAVDVADSMFSGLSQG